MTVHVLLFGHYKDAAPNGALTLAGLPNGASVATVAERLAAHDERLTDLLARARVAVGGDFAAADTVLHNGDEIAFLPPMSGG
jgi:molybdopterin synthase catalytic subunit